MLQAIIPINNDTFQLINIFITKPERLDSLQVNVDISRLSKALARKKSDWSDGPIRLNKESSHGATDRCKKINAVVRQVVIAKMGAIYLISGRKKARIIRYFPRSMMIKVCQSPVHGIAV